MDSFGRLDELLERSAEEGWDLRVKLDIETETCWSAEVAVTPEPHREDGPDRSYVSFSVAGTSADEALGRALADIAEWQLAGRVHVTPPATA